MRFICLLVCLISMSAFGAGMTPFTNRFSLYVDPYGSNSKGSKGHPDLPFKTIGAAKTNASAGDTIIVNAGTYTENNLLKAGVNYQFMPGVTITAMADNTVLNSFYGIFDDRATGATTNTISGRPNLVYSTGTNGLPYDVTVVEGGATNSIGAVVITNAATRLTAEFGTINFGTLNPTNDGTLAAISVRNCSLVSIKVKEILDSYILGVPLTNHNDEGDPVTANSHGTAVYWETGEFYLDFEHVGVFANYGIWGVEQTGSHTANMWITGQLMETTLYMSAHSLTWKSWSDIKEILTTGSRSAGAVAFYGGKNYLRSMKISESVGACVYLTSGGEHWITCQKMSAVGQWLILNSNCTLDLNCMLYEDLGGVDRGFDIEGTNQVLRMGPGYAKAITGRAFYYNGAAKALINGMQIVATNRVAVEVAASGLTLQNCTLISKTTSNSIYATSAQNVGVIGGMANTAKAASVTIQPGTLVVDSNLQ